LADCVTTVRQQPHSDWCRLSACWTTCWWNWHFRNKHPQAREEWKHMLDLRLVTLFKFVTRIIIWPVQFKFKFEGVFIGKDSLGRPTKP
jgi:hypothetical protein